MSRILLGRKRAADRLPNQTVVTLEFKPQDLWIGVFWRHNVQGFDGGWWESWDFWVVLVPMLPVHFSFDRSNKDTRAFRRWAKTEIMAP